MRVMPQANERAATIAATLVLVVGMGFGRFAFTGLYPLMVAERQISIDGGSYAASANYAGYLIGALLAALLTGIASRKLCAFATITTAIALGLLALPLPEWLVVAIRGFAGLFSAVSMVAASHWLIHDRRHHDGAPALYSGVGIGILVSAEMIALGRVALLSSRAIWFVLALAALTLTIVSIAMQRRSERSKPHPARSDPASDEKTPAVLGATRLIVIYGLAGLGYIITATYLPLLVRSALASVDPVHIWAVFGLAAAPSCFLWHFLHERWGGNRSLVANLGVQAVGVLLPVLHTPAAYVASALLVGATFMGTVTIAMPAACRIAAKVHFNMLAIMAAAYGVGQIAGPIMANALYARTASFDASLVVAALVLVLAAALCFGQRPARRREQAFTFETEAQQVCDRVQMMHRSLHGSR
jgi:predicted MFS family arabinose efflux permease